MKPVEEYKLSTYIGEEIIRNTARSKIERVTSSLNEKTFLKKTFYEDKREIFNALKELDIPSLVHIHEVIYDEERKETVVIEDFIEGETLDKASEGKDITDKELKCYFTSLLEALKALHGRNIIHRDIKPENIIITYDKKAVLIDCGIARLYKGESAPDTETLGTRGYAAPEQYGFAPSGPETDIYALGKTVMDVCRECGIGGSVLKTAKKCARFDPQNRFQSAEEALKALERGNAPLYAALLCTALLTVLLLFSFIKYMPQKEKAPLTEPVRETRELQSEGSSQEDRSAERDKSSVHGKKKVRQEKSDEARKESLTRKTPEAPAPTQEGDLTESENPWQIVSKRDASGFSSLLINSGNAYKKQAGAYKDKSGSVKAEAEADGRGNLTITLEDNSGRRQSFVFTSGKSEADNSSDAEVLFMDLDGDGIKEIFPVLSERHVSGKRSDGTPVMYRYIKTELWLVKHRASGGFAKASESLKYHSEITAPQNQGIWNGVVGDPSGMEASFCGDGAGKLYIADSSGMKPAAF